MNEPRCECCDLPVNACGKGLERRLLAEQKRERAAAKPRHGVSTEAKYAGRCKLGNEPIRQGDEITYDEEHGWVCQGCATELDS